MKIGEGCSRTLRYVNTNMPTQHKLNIFLISFQSPDQMTTSVGAPVGDKLNSQTAGPKGPLLLQDFVFIDEMAHFDRERIPERVVHAKGAGQCPSIM